MAQTTRTTPAGASRRTARPFGIDFGGSGIKGAPVDLATGEFAAERTRIETPPGGRPREVADVVTRLVESGAAKGAPVGITVPGVVAQGVVKTAANIDKSWVGTDAVALFRERLDRDVIVVNDADAAGLAEARYGAAKGQSGLVVLTTLGTGIGTALVYDGVLVPNSELGHLEIGGKDAETQAANSVRERKDLSWKEWAKLLTRYYRTLERLISPNLFVVGGGVSKHSDKFLPLLKIETPIVAATLRNTAGIVGAAALAAEAKTTARRTR
jgi:polyphosphate glucokinase